MNLKNLMFSLLLLVTFALPVSAMAGGDPGASAAAGGDDGMNTSGTFSGGDPVVCKECQDLARKGSIAGTVSSNPEASAPAAASTASGASGSGK